MSAAFERMMDEARKGNNEALLQLLEWFEPEIHALARFIKMPKEDSIQEIKAQFIAFIREGD
ncbi:helix-turn-helix domain-containing protein [Brevibacillus thermoruber]|uniref:helix-turn-helix domain-containing protein n=1 Tax=Brevibacillus thermoruber TaxID=33942 RepID=UPI0012693F72|nr:helix-turn-helix domain-containing protein [Brevibacillus thermoruber]